MASRTLSKTYCHHVPPSIRSSTLPSNYLSISPPPRTPTTTDLTDTITGPNLPIINLDSINLLNLPNHTPRHTIQVTATTAFELVQLLLCQFADDGFGGFAMCAEERGGG